MRHEKRKTMTFNESLIQKMREVSEASESLDNIIQYNDDQTETKQMIDPQSLYYFGDALQSVRLRAIVRYNKRLQGKNNPKEIHIED